MAALGHIRLHARKDAQSVGKFQHILRTAAYCGQIAVEFIELQSIEVFGEAQGIQTGPPGFTEEPVGISGGKGQLFGQLSMGVKIKSQRKNLLSKQCGEQNGQSHP